MNKHEFIFSNKRRHRFARHFVFWTIWCVAFNVLFHFPIHVFKGWDTSGPGTKNFQQLGPVLFFIKSLLVNCLFGVIIPQVALTYVLIYWLLPKYFYNTKNYLPAVAATVAVLLLFYFFAIVFKYSPVVYNSIAGTGGGSVSFFDLSHVVMIDQVSSLPIVLGFALMITLVKRWWLKQKETALLAKEKTNAELQLLKAQVHPHFLFNTLNNIYFFTLTNSTQAPVMIKKLSGLLNYILNECDAPLVPLEKEIKMLQDYMALEKIRYAQQMEMTIEIEGIVTGKMIAPLLLIPFVENSFKHGASKMINHPWVDLRIKIDNRKLCFFIRNSQPAATQAIHYKAGLPARQGNIGLRNVTKRLELLYPGTHELSLINETDSYSVYLSLQLHHDKIEAIINDEIKSVNEYALA